MKVISYLISAIIVCLIAVGSVSALTSNEVLVVYNSNSITPGDNPNFNMSSEGVAKYYLSARGVPAANLLNLSQAPYTESCNETHYLAFIATPIWNYLSTRPHIKCIVLCYGIPSWVSVPASNGRRSVDSYLTLLGNDGSLDAATMRSAKANPYYNSNMDFRTFFSSSANAVRVGSATWKLNYLVTRLDGYSVPTTSVTINNTTYNIPSDIKAMIDRAVLADSNGTAGLVDAQAVVDDAPDGYNAVRCYPTSTEDQLNSLLHPITGSQYNVWREPGATSQTNTYAMSKQNVILYSSNGSYDDSANSVTSCWRPCFGWKNGAIGMYWNVSGDGYWLRTPTFWKPWLCGSEPDVEPYTLKIKNNNGIYDGCIVRLYDQETLLAQAQFQTESQMRIARIDLSSITLTNGGKHTYIECYFPATDPYHPNRPIGGTANIGSDLYTALETGYTYRLNGGQSLAAELIRDGASGTTANAGEPGANCVANPNIALPAYATGYSWAESAWMSTPLLAWQQLVIGDPLMAPFAAKPTVSFLPPTPADGSNVRGQVALAADAEPDGTGSIDRVEFYVVGTNQNPKLVGTDNDAPYFTSWDTTENFADGEYTILAVAYQLNERFGATTTSVSVTLNNSSAPAVYINSPDADNLAVGQTTPVLASVSPSASRVQFWLYWDNTLVFCGEDDNAPYECIITPTTASDGVYKIQAIAYDDVTDTISYSVKRQLIVHNSGSFVQSVVDAADEPDETLIMLANVPVAAGTSAAMKRTPASTANAFYVEDVNRAAGLRIETSIADEVDAGRLLTIQGTLHKGQSENERYLEASGIWDMGAAEPPKPLGMSNAFVGGKPPAGTPGIEGGVGLFNTGLLVKAWGKVTYVGDDYVYIDDGSGLQDGNTLQSSIVVPLDGSPIPAVHSSAKGVRVCFGSFEKPGIGDYVSITGISSVTKIGDNVVRLIRVRDQGDIVYAQSYQTCRKTQPYGRFVGLDSSTIPLGSKVRLVDTLVQANYGTHLNLLHTGITGIFSWVHAYTLLPTYQHLFKMVTVIGSSVGSSYGDEIVADCIYQGGSRFGALSLWDDGFNIDAPCAASSLNESENSERGGGPFRPWPSPAVADIISSVRFNTAYNRPGNIGWILSQSEGSVHDVQAVVVRGNWFDGRVLGLREWYEPIRHGPNLFLYLDAPIKLEANYREYATIDIIGAKLVTLSDGRRALVQPEAVYVYTDSKGGRIPPLPWLKTEKTTPISEQWMWKVKVAP